MLPGAAAATRSALVLAVRVDDPHVEPVGGEVPSQPRRTTAAAVRGRSSSSSPGASAAVPAHSREMRPAEPHIFGAHVSRGRRAAEPESTSDAPDIHTTAGKLAQLRKLNDEAIHAGSSRAVEAQHAKGKMTARERILALLDEGSFVETDALARHRAHDFGVDKNRPYGDGVVTGYGTIDGRPVCVFSQDFTVFGGSLGEVFGEKIVKVMDLALKTGCPVIGINDSGGARIQEGVVSLGLYGEIFYRNVMASGVVPQISLIMGPCAGGAVYSPAITDFTLMVDQTSHMFITGPGRHQDGHRRGRRRWRTSAGRATHNSKSGVAHFMASDENDCLELTKVLLSYLPSNNLEEAPAVRAGGPRRPRARPRARHVHPGLVEHALRHAHASSSTSSTTASSSRSRRCGRRTSSPATAGSTAGRSASSRTSRCSSPGR